ncbi:MAG: mechanosensitive ion channel family protein, partial [Gemmatimonadales bacterium]
MGADTLTFSLSATVALVLPVALTIGGLLVGIVLQRLLLGPRVRPAGAPVRSRAVELLGTMLRGPIALWSAILGLYLATALLPLPPRVAAVLPPILVVLVILSVTWSVARLAAVLVASAARRVEGGIPSASLLVNLARIGVMSIGVLIILQTLGVSITPLLTALGIGGLAVGLALQDTLANFFAGLHILSSRQVRAGDYVRLDTGEEGYVEDVTWRYTMIRQLANNMIVVPNAKLASTVLTNYHLPALELAVLVPVGVSYDSDLARVEEVTVAVGRDVMREVPGGVPDFEPFIRYGAFSDSSITFTVILRGREFVSQYLICHEFIKRLHERYRREGITIPFPIRSLTLAPGAARALRDAAQSGGGG